MRVFLLLVMGCLLGGASRADSFVPGPELKEFAQRYAEAVKTRDFARIETFFLPALRKPETPSAQATVERWKASFDVGLLPSSDPVWINTKAFEANLQVMASGRWAAQPEYQIEIQSHHPANGGEEGGPLVDEAVCRQAGHFYIVRPLPQ